MAPDFTKPVDRNGQNLSVCPSGPSLQALLRPTSAWRLRRLQRSASHADQGRGGVSSVEGEEGPQGRCELGGTGVGNGRPEVVAVVPFYELLAP
jgi:hypothetical protein